MIKRLLQLIAVFSLLFAATSYAALDLELTQGVDQAIPVVMVPFGAVSQILQQDLANSGRFNVTTATKVNYASWRQQKINSAIVGSEQVNGSKYTIAVKLLDVYSQKALLNQQFTVDKSQLRALAHHIADLIYQQLTGVRGVFSTKIAYVLVQRSPKGDKYSLMVADQDGYNPQALLVSTQPIMSPAWSPNGKQLAYVSFEQHRAAIYLQNVATGQRRVVAKYPGINGAPAWSPDGKKLALVLTLTGYPKIYVLHLASGKLQRLTNGWSIDTEPCWAPDGKTLIFTSGRGGSPQVYQYTFASGKITRLTYTGNYNAKASFTSDGKKIVMLNRDSGMFNIALQNLANGRVNILTQFGMDESPSIAPNGSMVVYATNYGGRGILAEVSIDGRVKLRLPAQEGEVQEPAWSPFSNSHPPT